MSYFTKLSLVKTIQPFKTINKHGLKMKSPTLCEKSLGKLTSSCCVRKTSAAHDHMDKQKEEWHT